MQMSRGYIRMVDTTYRNNEKEQGMAVQTDRNAR